MMQQEGNKVPETAESHRLTWLDVVNLVAGGISLTLAVLALAVSKEARDTLFGAAHSYGPKILLWSSILGGVACLSTVFYRTLRLRKTDQENARLKKATKGLQEQVLRLDSEVTGREKAERQAAELRSENARLTEENRRLSMEDTERKAQDELKMPESARRWDTFEKIEYGHLPYEPFLEYDGGTPGGLGIDILTKLLDDEEMGSKAIRIHPYDTPGNWANILQGLIDKQYDVVATPLFATYERCQLVRFTSPLFFSNIGLYVSKKVAELDIWKHLTVRDLPSRIAQVGLRFRPARDFKLLSVKGEISEKLAKKNARDSIESLPTGFLPRNTFEKVFQSANPYYGVFCESYFACRQKLVQEGEVVNVLPLHQILYPVCFAVRMSDYHLANLLNIRLLERTRNGGALKLLTEKLAESSGFTQVEVNKHFVAEWPLPKVGEDKKETTLA